MIMNSAWIVNANYFFALKRLNYMLPFGLLRLFWEGNIHKEQEYGMTQQEIYK